MDIHEIRSNKRSGDHITVGAMVGMASEAARMALNNPRHKRHNEVLKAYEKIIVEREALINTKATILIIRINDSIHDYLEEKIIWDFPCIPNIGDFVDIETFFSREKLPGKMYDYCFVEMRFFEKIDNKIILVLEMTDEDIYSYQRHR